MRGVDATGLDAVLRFFYSGEWPLRPHVPPCHHRCDLLVASGPLPSLELLLSPGETTASREGEGHLEFTHHPLSR